MSDKLLYGIPAAAARLDVSRRTLERMLERGEIRAVRPGGGARKITAAELQRYHDRMDAPASNAAGNAVAETASKVTQIDRGMAMSLRRRAQNVAKRQAGGEA